MSSNQISLWTKNWLEKTKLSHTYLKETTSTNDLAKSQAFKLKTPHHIFVTAKQTKGRGQRHNEWMDSDLMITWLWGDVHASIHAELSKDFSFGLLKSVKKNWPKEAWTVKPPNDLYLANKKVAGLLLEVLDQAPKKALILGLGFNVFSHPPDLDATHLAQHNSLVSEEIWMNFLNELHQTWSHQVLK